MDPVLHPEEAAALIARANAARRAGGGARSGGPPSSLPPSFPEPPLPPDLVAVIEGREAPPRGDPGDAPDSAGVEVPSPVRVRSADPGDLLAADLTGGGRVITTGGEYNLSPSELKQVREICSRAIARSMREYLRALKTKYSLK